MRFRAMAAQLGADAFGLQYNTISRISQIRHTQQKHTYYVTNVWEHIGHGNRNMPCTSRKCSSSTFRVMPLWPQ